MTREPTPLETLAMEQSRATHLESTKCLLEAFSVLGIPRRLLDVGCGDGHLVRVASALGTPVAMGIDVAVPMHVATGISLVPRELEAWEGEGPDPFDLVLCLEVAEHLEERYADNLCEKLYRSTGQTLLFSAATPGQGGAGHVNEQPHAYWIEKLTRAGLDYAPVLTDLLRTKWLLVAPGAWWYGKNLLAFHQTGVVG